MSNYMLWGGLKILINSLHFTPKVHEPVLNANLGNTKINRWLQQWRSGKVTRESPSIHTQILTAHSSSTVSVLGHFLQSLLSQISSLWLPTASQSPLQLTVPPIPSSVSDDICDLYLRKEKHELGVTLNSWAADQSPPCQLLVLN